MTENEKLRAEMKAMKATLRALKIGVDGINCHLEAIERKLRVLKNNSQSGTKN